MMSKKSKNKDQIFDIVLVTLNQWPSTVIAFPVKLETIDSLPHGNNGLTVGMSWWLDFHLDFNTLE